LIFRGLFFSHNENIGQKGSLQRAHLSTPLFSASSVHEPGKVRSAGAYPPSASQRNSRPPERNRRLPGRHNNEIFVTIQRNLKLFKFNLQIPTFRL